MGTTDVDNFNSQKVSPMSMCNCHALKKLGYNETSNNEPYTIWARDSNIRQTACDLVYYQSTAAKYSVIMTILLYIYF